MMSSIKIIQNDICLKPYELKIKERIENYQNKLKIITKDSSLNDFADGYLFFGCHKTEKCWIFREWMPNAKEIYLISEHSNWKKKAEYSFSKKNNYWYLEVPLEKLKHYDLYRLLVVWNGGEGERLPAYVRRIVQDNTTKIFNAQIWNPKNKYKWKYRQPADYNYKPIIYEAHVGMAHETGKVASYIEFKENVLPHIVEGGYNTIQLMALQEHPYYGSFGYQVANFFAASSRFGTPEELKELIDEAHKYGLKVIMDLVHSHAAKNEIEGIAKYDGTEYQFFHEGTKGNHPAWDTKCFNYGKDEVIHFLLSNCKFWLEEYKIDGFRFDGVTSMLYFHHGLEKDFTDYKQYYSEDTDKDAQVYLMLANKLIHSINKNAITIAEDMSGMPGLAASIDDGGFGFNYRLAMGIPDFWIKIIKEKKDEEWDINNIYYELNNRRQHEGAISYVESHDQALVGDKTMIFRFIDKEMYYSMEVGNDNIIVERGIALNKMIRLITIATARDGYLNFMGNEFGHPEWIDFPREGNNWSYKYCRRQWSLLKNKSLRYYMLNEFDKAMIALVKNNNCFNELYTQKTFENIQDQVIAFKRGSLLFIFNFNPHNSYSDYKINADAGEYRLLLSTDDLRYDGFDRVSRYTQYFSQPQGNSNQISVYIPARTALVLKLI